MNRARRKIDPQNTVRELRIIGGKWRGRRIVFHAVPGLRPTPDRVRETLFNWLQPAIHGSRCLDLFSGSGALGLEALSRGAAEVVMIDSSSRATNQIKTNLQRFGNTDAQVLQADAASWLASCRDRVFDIVFLDPPFHSELAARCLDQLHNSALLSPGASVYLETAASETPPQLPAGWVIHRERVAGEVAYRLLHASPDL